MIYWSIAIGVGAALAYAVIPELIPFLAKSQQGAAELQYGVSQQTP